MAPSVDIKDLQALILVGPTGTSPVLDPLAVLHLDNQLFMNGLQAPREDQYFY